MLFDLFCNRSSRQRLCRACLRPTSCLLSNPRGPRMRRERPLTGRGTQLMTYRVYCRMMLHLWVFSINTSDSENDVLTILWRGGVLTMISRYILKGTWRVLKTHDGHYIILTSGLKLLYYKEKLFIVESCQFMGQRSNFMDYVVSPIKGSSTWIVFQPSYYY